MHRVFRAGASSGQGVGLDEIRGFLRSLGLVEEPAGGAFLYRYVRDGGEAHHFATLNGGRHTATVYLYPDALGRALGHAHWFYRALDEAGLGMGSKAGPSIGIDLDDDAQVSLFCAGLARLFEPET